MLLGAGYKNKVKNTILNIICTLLTFIGLRIFCLCHRNFCFALHVSVILYFCLQKKQRERSLLIPSLRPFMLIISFSIKSQRQGVEQITREKSLTDLSLAQISTNFRLSPLLYKTALLWVEEARQTHRLNNDVSLSHFTKWGYHLTRVLNLNYRPFITKLCFKFILSLIFRQSFLPFLLLFPYIQYFFFFPTLVLSFSIFSPLFVIFFIPCSEIEYLLICRYT